MRSAELSLPASFLTSKSLGVLVLGSGVLSLERGGVFVFVLDEWPVIRSLILSSSASTRACSSWSASNASRYSKYSARLPNYSSPWRAARLLLASPSASSWASSLADGPPFSLDDRLTGNGLWSAAGSALQFRPLGAMWSFPHEKHHADDILLGNGILPLGLFYKTPY